ncbi:hypothetical protein BDQ12DRAFT_728666 [Crucibulum laeve]|uniref:Uncharacterized protein n=1 Tax=Crucibulum laeve TaxID=68775 RepID=A0A5C3LI02_9AGAR|nr:hypothetical protein BDQ12DRAFT_728666 [Crucibulum laeve]
MCITASATIASHTSPPSPPSILSDSSSAIQSRGNSQGKGGKGLQGSRRILSSQEPGVQPMTKKEVERNEGQQKSSRKQKAPEMLPSLVTNGAPQAKHKHKNGEAHFWTMVEALTGLAEASQANNPTSGPTLSTTTTYCVSPAQTTHSTPHIFSFDLRSNIIYLISISLISQSHINLYSSKSSPAVEPHSGQIFPPNRSLYNLPLSNSLLAIEPLLQLSDSALQFQIILVPS